MAAERLGKYELVHHLASGGMASVYLARLAGLGGFERHVVLKTLRAPSEESVAMFLDEARLVATLHHQHIAQVFEVGRVDDTYFLAMEYIHGETVRAVLETAVGREQSLGLDFGVSVGVAAAAGLHHAHEQCASDGTPLNIVHRDVSPSNVIVGFDGAIKLIDFGIAKADARSTETATGFIKGKAGYMAPEQVLGYEVDRRSDVFSLGVLMYELTTQTRAFAAASQFESTHRIVHGELSPPSGVVTGYPIELEDVVMTALSVDPDDRFQDAAAMHRALVQVAQELHLALGTAPVIRVVDQLYGTRREPWLTPRRRTSQMASATARPVAMPPPPPPVPPRPAPPPVPPPVPAGLPPIVAVRPPVPAGLLPIVAALPSPRDESFVGEAPVATVTVSSDEATTHRIMTVPPERIAEMVTPSTGMSPLPLPAPPIPMSALLGPAYARPGSPGESGDAWPTPVVLPSRVDMFPADRGSSVIRLSRRLVIAGGSLAIACGVGIALITLSRGGGPKASVVASPPPAPPPPIVHRAPAPRPAPQPQPQQPAAPADQVMLKVTSTPDGASVVLDGVKLGTTPFAGPVPIKLGTAVLKVRKPKYKPIRTTITLDHDIVWEPVMPELP